MRLDKWDIQRVPAASASQVHAHNYMNQIYIMDGVISPLYKTSSRSNQVKMLNCAVQHTRTQTINPCGGGTVAQSFSL